ncbi:hypothetical protein F2Q69_00043960 [Brassica cretica]|uniref:Reverse transcriptase zinc-binding domain-containing protein n=1 Tax=Brassica cretica TaxID=69181 RepID=A0A8S9NJG9_BRACR|nr:hypothetical protein F2Q69_00043960 [Brassica cretica]
MNRGRLIDITGVVGTTYLGVTRQSKALYTDVISLNPPHTSLGCDIMLWKHGEDDFRDNFSSSTTWNQIRKKKDREQWSRVVWFAQGVPRYGFITWLAMKHRLSTGDRMRQWGVQGCEMCGERDETRDHLYFACPYSYTVWKALANRILGQGINPGSSWTVQYLIGTHHRLDSVLAKMLFQTTIYHIWRERNARRHHQIPTTADQMKRRVDKAMRTRIISLKYPFHHKLAGLLQRWFLHTM